MGGGRTGRYFEGGLEGLQFPRKGGQDPVATSRPLLAPPRPAPRGPSPPQPIGRATLPPPCPLLLRPRPFAFKVYSGLGPVAEANHGCLPRDAASREAVCREPGGAGAPDAALSTLAELEVAGCPRSQVLRAALRKERGLGSPEKGTWEFCRVWQRLTPLWVALTQSTHHLGKGKSPACLRSGAAAGSYSLSSTSSSEFCMRPMWCTGPGV